MLIQYLKSPFNSEITSDVSHSSLMGLPIPVAWVCNEANAIKDDKMEFHENLSGAVCMNGSLKSESIKTIPGATNKKDPEDSSVVLVDQMGTRNVDYPVPGLPADSWSDFEVDCFILGLYIFGKNLLQVKRLMDNKGTGQFLSLYYGKFYRSAGYYRWCHCEKMKIKSLYMDIGLLQDVGCKNFFLVCFPVSQNYPKILCRRSRKLLQREEFHWKNMPPL
ncbi:hypothetical protein Nepgr_001569 [Nepenthes gracilis]|uniref:DUF7952 domain-containing protein n=1 Tax=Nepenthes gracilis TaxID=150966 RepID=A0AAD3P2U6_NEPGR|nr:hypothetical protein Nepgr_001569 [Nepenthes gracilis]